MKASSSCIRLTQAHWEQMKADVISHTGEEACGFVLGAGNTSQMVLPVENLYHDPFRFRMDPQQELYAFLLAEEKNWEILAIYHSHPHGISEPSHSDLDELTFPGTIYLIWYQVADRWECRAYLMQSQSGTDEVAITIIDG